MVEYRNLDNDTLLDAINQDLQEVMALLTKPDADKGDLRAAILKLMKIYDQLEMDTHNQELLQVIRQAKNGLQSGTLQTNTR